MIKKLCYGNFLIVMLAVFIHIPVRADACDAMQLTALVDSVTVNDDQYGLLTNYSSSVTSNGTVVTVYTSGVYTDTYGEEGGWLLLQDIALFTAAGFVPGSSYTLFLSTKTFNISGGAIHDDASYIGTRDCSGTNCAGAGPIEIPIGSIDGYYYSFLQLQIITSELLGTVEFEFEWELLLVRDGCPYPGSPSSPTPTPGGDQILAVPAGCDGIELLPGEYPELLWPDDTWGGMFYNLYYEPVKVRFIFKTNTGIEYDTHLNINGWEVDVAFTGSAAGQYTMYTPNRTFQNAAAQMNVTVKNISPANAMFLQSVCVSPERQLSCYNADPEIDTEWQWGPVDAVIENGIANISAGGYIQQQQYMSPGRYRITFQAHTYPQGQTPLTLITHIGNLSAGGWDALYKQIVVPSTELPTLFYYDFWLNDGQFNPTLKISVSGDGPFSTVRVYYVCITLLEAFVTPTPTATPRPPTPTPLPPSTCGYPPSYNFSIPSMWTLNGSNILRQSGTQNNILILNSNGSAQQQLALARGTWLVSVRAKRQVSGSEQAAFRVTLGGRSLGEWVIPGSVPRTEPHDYVNQFYSYGSGAEPFMIQAALPGYYGGTIEHICLVYIDDPPPLPTPILTNTPDPSATPGPTPTSTPPAQPPVLNCINDDPNIEGTGGQWVVLGEGYISDGSAYVYPDAMLTSEMQYDAQSEYDMWVSGYCTNVSTAAVYWRGQMQMLYCVGANLPFARSFLWLPYEGGAMVSTPLMDLLQPPLGDNALLPSDLPPGYAPNLIMPLFAEPGTSPLQEPDFPESHYMPLLMSPLQEPAPPGYFPQGEIDPLLLTLSHIFQLKAMAANTGPIVVTSVCVRDRGWTPPPEPVEITIYHPLCERDWQVQLDYSDAHPGQIIGPGAVAGMPVHAPYAGRVETAGANEFQYIGETRYDGCVVIDHSAQLNVSMFSVLCNLDTFTVMPGVAVGRGDVIGYTGAGGAVGKTGILAFALRLNGPYVDPGIHVNGWPDCRPYSVIIEPVEQCEADDGSGLIPPRYNMDPPSLWEPIQWVPWLARRLYDTVGYPMLCALVPLINRIQTWIAAAVNLILGFFSPLAVFAYRISRVFEYGLELAGRVLASFLQMFVELDDLTACYRSIIVYFISSMQASRTAESTPLVLPVGPLLFGINLALLLISSTVANSILVPVVGLFISYASWKLVPWGVRHIRSAIGSGD